MVSGEVNATRVMLVIHGLGMGGAETMVRNLALALHGAGVPVVVVSLHSGDTPVADTIREGGVAVVALNKRRGPDPSVILRLKRLMDEFRPTVVHTHLPVLEYVVPAARLHGRVVKVVHTFHSVAQKETRIGLLVALNKRAFRSGMALPVALNDEVRDSICEVYGLAADNVPVVCNGIDLGRFRLAGEGRARGGILRLLCVARFEDVKNHSLLVRTLAVLAAELDGAVRLTLVGDGPLREETEGLAAKLGVGDLVEFVGQKTDTAPYFGGADVFVLLSKYEGLPMSVIEAMASGLPVVAANVGGLPGIVRPGVNGMLVGHDAGEAARAILDVAGDDATYSALSHGALATSLEYSSGRMMGGYLDLYN